jgi:hypothetical protein
MEVGSDVRPLPCEATVGVEPGGFSITPKPIGTSLYKEANCTDPEPRANPPTQTIPPGRVIEPVLPSMYPVAAVDIVADANGAPVGIPSTPLA